MGLRSMLPPVNSLVAFEAAARQLHFTRAGIELNVSQAAISRQVKILEDDLGVKLFHRGPNGLTLTADGQRLYGAVNDSLIGIARSCMEVRRVSRVSSVTISASISFSIFWLAPLISNFREANADIDLRLVMTDPFVAPDLQNCDMAIRFGQGRWPNWQSQQMFGEEIIPVCSPAMLHIMGGPAENLETLLRLPLLHLDMTDPGGLDWRTWVRSLRIDEPTIIGGPQFNNYAVMIEVAKSGHGICLACRSLVQHLLDAKSLVLAGPIGVRTARAYFLATPDDRVQSRAGKIAFDWIVGEAKKHNDRLEQSYLSALTP